MLPASPALLNWEPGTREPGTPLSLAEEHKRGPVQPTTPRRLALRACAVESPRMPSTPRVAADLGEIRELMQVQGDVLMKRMEALMLQQEHMIFRLLDAPPVFNNYPTATSASVVQCSSDDADPHSNEANPEVAAKNTQQSGSSAESTETPAHCVSNCSSLPKPRPSQTRSTTFDLDFGNRMKSALVMQKFATKVATESQRNVGGIATRFSDLVTWSRETPKRETDSRLCGLAIEFGNSAFFDALCGTMISLNAAFLGISTDMAARKTDPDALPQFFTHAERVFSIWFLFELSVRMAAHGFLRFFLGREWSWNVFDALVVLLDVVETFAHLARSSLSFGRSNFTAMRILRVLRIVRTIRVIRLVRFFKELRMMIISVLRSGLLLLWSMMLLIIILFMFSSYLTQIVTYYLYDHSDERSEAMEKLHDYFGSLPFAGYMLFQCMSGGISWGEVSGPLLEIHWSNGLVICFFIFFTVFAVLNIFTAIFVDTAFKSAMADRHEVIQEAIDSEDAILSQMRKFFEQADLDKSGSITLEELQQQLQDPGIRAQLMSVGIEVNDAASIFRLLDIDKSGSINIEEFVFGCLQMQGTAKSIDLVTLMQQHKRLKDRLTKLCTFIEEGLRQQQLFHFKLESLFVRGKLYDPHDGKLNEAHEG